MIREHCGQYLERVTRDATTPLASRQQVHHIWRCRVCGRSFRQKRRQPAIPYGDKPRNERFLDALVEELRTMPDTDALEGEDAEELLKLGENLLKSAREAVRRLKETK